MNPLRSAILYIGLGSLIVLIGVIFYILEIAGYTGMIVIGILVEFYGIYLFWDWKKKRKK